MVDFWLELFSAFWILIPAYAANGFPPLARGRYPIDMGKKLFDNNRIFGDGKTIEGFFYGLIMGTFYGSVEWYLSPIFNEYATTQNLVLPLMTPFIAFMISFGALFGDLISSFIKRRFKLKRGAEVPLLDQLNFVVGAIAFSFLFTRITIWMVLIMIVITPLIHRFASIIGYALKFKRVPW